MEKNIPNPAKNDFSQLVEAWLLACRTEGLSSKTLVEYSDKMTRFMWWWHTQTGYSKTLGQHPRFVTPKEAKEFIAYLREPQTRRWGVKAEKSVLSSATVAGYGRIVKAFFNWCEREGYIENCPFNKSVKFTNGRNRQEKEIKNVSKDKLAKIFATLTDPKVLNTFAGKRNLAIISLLLDSGIRRGELLSMRLDDLDVVKMSLSVAGKTGPRTALFSDRCKGVLLDYLKARKALGKDDPGDPLWLTVDGEELKINSFQSMIARLELRSGVDFHAHQLRHTFALLMSTKVSLFELRDLLGHTSITTTQIYVQNNSDMLGNAYRSNSPLTTLEEDLPGLRRPGRPRKKI